MIERRRILLSPSSKPRLKSHVRLQYDKIRQAWAVLSPEKIFWPDEVSLNILQLCDGEHQLPEMIAKLANTFDASEDEIRQDVADFLQNWSDRSLVIL